MMILGMPKAGHFDVRDQTMADVVAAGASSDDTLIGKT